MKITKLRILDQKVTHLNQHVVEACNMKIQQAFQKAGFECDVRILEGKISGHMCQFKIDPVKRGYNIITYSNGKTKRTRTPTWDDRVEFNNNINKFFDKYKISAKIVSGIFVVRDATTGTMTEDDWFQQEVDNGNYWAGFSSGRSMNGLGQVMSTLSKMVVAS